MYIAKFKTTEETAQGTRFYVDFTNGTNTITEWCIPQDKDGFDYWVKGRLQAINSAELLKQQVVAGEEIVIAQTEPIPELTEEQIAFLSRKQAWFEAKEKLRLFLELKDMAEKTGKTVDLERLAQIDALATFVDENIEADFFN